MIQKALQYLVSLKDNKTYQINGKTYSDHKLELIEDERFYRKEVEFNSLDAIVKMIKAEIKDYTGVVFIRVKDHKNVYGCCFASDIVVKPNGDYEFDAVGLKANNLLYETEDYFKTKFIDPHLEKYNGTEKNL